MYLVLGLFSVKVKSSVFCKVMTNVIPLDWYGLGMAYRITDILEKPKLSGILLWYWV